MTARATGTAAEPVGSGGATARPRACQRHPGVVPDVQLEDRVGNWVEDRVDVGFRLGLSPHEGLIARRLLPVQLIVCASPAYLAQHGTPQHPAELAQHAVISYVYWSTKDEWRFTGPDGPVSVKTQPIMNTNSGDTCRAAALAHQGIVLQPSFLVGRDVAEGTLVELMPQYKSLELGIYAVYPTRKHVSAKVRVLIEFLQKHFSAQRDW